MKSILRICLLLIIPIIGIHLAWATVLPKNIKIFIASPSAFENKGRVSQDSITIEVFDLSLTKKIEEVLSRNLSDNPTIAIGQATSRIQNNIKALKSSFRKAVRAQNLANQFGISQLPAAVIDDKVILYGTTDLDEILKEWINSRNAR